MPSGVLFDASLTTYAEDVDAIDDLIVDLVDRVVQRRNHEHARKNGERAARRGDAHDDMRLAGHLTARKCVFQQNHNRGGYR